MRFPSLSTLALAALLTACASGGEETPDSGVLPPPSTDGAVDAGVDGGTIPDDSGRPPVCADLTCDANATCDASSGAPRCVCDPGFEGDGFSCVPVDECPEDPDKTAPGMCGCGVPDTDTDGDASADCIDGCAMDAEKTAPGACGCGVPDTDGDGDGVPDCSDGCPADPAKTSAGTCGCGTPDDDTDGDLSPDCLDGCPGDMGKTAPGACGCGVPDTDGDGDGTADCVDGCPMDPAKTAPGMCGCGVPEASGGVATIAEPRANNWTASRYFRSNIYRATAATTLESFEQYLGLSSSCSVTFYVLSGASSTGPWTQLWSSTQTLGAGDAYRPSGPIRQSITPGTYYVLGMGWNCSATYYGNSASSWVGHDTAVGTFERTAWDNAYPGHSASYTPPNTGSGGTAYAQRVTTAGCP